MGVLALVSVHACHDCSAPVDTSLKISAGTNGGPRSRVCARLTLHSAPHQQVKISQCVCPGRGQFFVEEVTRL